MRCAAPAPGDVRESQSIPETDASRARRQHPCEELILSFAPRQSKTYMVRRASEGCDFIENNRRSSGVCFFIANEFATKTSVLWGRLRAMLAMRARQIVATRFMTGTSANESHGQTGHARTTLVKIGSDQRKGHRAIQSLTSHSRKSNQFSLIQLVCNFLDSARRPRYSHAVPCDSGGSAMLRFSSRRLPYLVLALFTGLFAGCSAIPGLPSLPSLGIAGS